MIRCRGRAAGFLALVTGALCCFPPAASATDDGVWSSVPGGPGRRDGATAVLDAGRNRIIVFGGQSAFNVMPNDTWVLTLGPEPAWSQLATSGTPPPGRFLHTAFYDPAHDRMYIYAGHQNNQPALGDVWSLSFSGTPTWTQEIVNPDFPSLTSPVARFAHVGVYDPARNEMLIFGGTTGCTELNDVWALRGGMFPSWDLITTSGAPPSARAYSLGIFDTTADRLVLVGGGGTFCAGAPPWWSDEIWTLNRGGSRAWSPQSTTGSPLCFNEPASGGVCHDALRSRLLFYGRADCGTPGVLVEALDLSSWSWSELDPSGSGPVGIVSSYATTMDAAADRMVLTGGYPGVTWLLTFAATSAVPGPPNARNKAWLLPPSPNPSYESVQIAFGLAAAAPVRVDVFDAAGRRVRELVNEIIPEGTHTVIWDGKDDGGARRPGVYFYRLTTGAERLAGKIVLAE